MKYLYVIHFLKKKWMTNHVPLLLQTTLFPKSKRGKQQAFANNASRVSAHKVIRQSPGPTRFAKSQCSEISDTFTLLLWPSLRKTKCRWTNHEEAIVYGSSWKPVDDGEFKVFPDVVTLIDVYKFNNESVEQLWSTLDGQPIFNRAMSKERYQQILRDFRFDKSQSRRHHRSPDKLQPLSKVFETRDSYLHDSYYTCRPSMAVDEQLVRFRGRCHFKQYIPSKPGKCGIKIWTICDSTCFYAWKIQVHHDIDSGSGQETNHGTRVVPDLVEMKILAKISIEIISSPLCRLNKNFLKRSSHSSIEPMRKNKPELQTEFILVK